MSSSRSLDRFGLALFGTLAVLPVLASLGYAALYAFGLTGLLSRGFTLAHARSAFTTSEVWASVGLSLYVAAAVVVLTATIALPLAACATGSRPLACPCARARRSRTSSSEPS